jgi:glc operon protein GlcG
MIAFKRPLAVGLLTAAAVLALGLGAAEAQLAKFVISPDAAKKLMTRNELSLDTAQKIANVCMDFAKAHNIALTIAIYDPFGEPVLIQRMDGQGKTNIETALLKAKTVLNTRRSSHVDMNRMLQGQSSEFHGAFFNGVFANKGGLPIVVDGEFLGAIGVGGSNMDEECAQAGLEKVLGQTIKLEPNLNIPRGGGAPRAGGGG